MAIRTSMAALIARVRILINDPAGPSQQFDDQTIQDVLDESRRDLVNQPLAPRPTFVQGTILWLDYYSEVGGWEDDFVLKQYLVRPVTASLAEAIVGHFQFAQSTLPPVSITGKLHDVYAGAAALLQRWASRLALDFDFSSDGQSFRRSQKMAQLLALAKTYAAQSRAGQISMQRGDLNAASSEGIRLGPQPIDWY